MFSLTILLKHTLHIIIFFLCPCTWDLYFTNACI